MKTINTLFVLVFIFVFLNSNSQNTSFKKLEVTDSFQEGVELCVIDLNQDGHIDIASVGKEENGSLVWWENDGYFNWIKHTVKDNFEGIRSVRAADLDNDGNIDLVAAGWISNDIIWFKNDGNEQFNEIIVDENFIGAHTVDLCDVNDDGNLDVLCSGFDYYGHNGEVAWWEYEGSSSFTKHLVTDRFQQSPFVYACDIDSDNDIDILACGELNNEVVWWENDGNQVFTEHIIDDEFSKAHTVFSRDIDLDGDMDILGAACISGKVAWWENDGNQNFSKHDLGGLGGALWLDAVDIDLDGDMDLYGGGMGVGKLVYWENDGNSDFTKYYLEDTFTSAFCVVAEDMDGDTDPDLIAIGYYSNEIAWFKNQTLNPDHLKNPECIVFDIYNDTYLVSNTCGMDSTGSILTIDEYGNTEIFIPGIDNPLGMYINDSILYVSDAKNSVLAFNVIDKEQIAEYAINPVGNLDGLTMDNEGILYVLDTYGKMYKINPDNGNVWLYVNGGMGSWPQDCVFDPANNQIIVAPYGEMSSLYAIDLSDSSISELVTTEYGRFDGINIDDEGNIYLSSHANGGAIIKYYQDFTNPAEVISQGHNEPAGLFYNNNTDVLAVTNFGSSIISFLPLGIIGLNNSFEEPVKSKIFPNPLTEHSKLVLDIDSPEKVKVSIYNTHGQLLKVIRDEIFQKGRHEIPVTHSNLPRGSYLIYITMNGSKQGIHVVK